MYRIAIFVGLFWCGLGLSCNVIAQEKIFSGPQHGEKLRSFEVFGVFPPFEGKKIDFIERADGKPLLLVFVHEINRPSIAMVRTLSKYALTRQKDGLTTGVIFLSADATEAETSIKKMKHAMEMDVPTGVSPDGVEGPGSYGLNRNVSLTILIARENQVIANFALIQPSLQSDLPKIVSQLVAVVGGEMPTLASLLGNNAAMATDNSAQVRELVRPLIQLNATSEQVQKAAESIEKTMANDSAFQKEIFRIATTIVGSGKLENYGTTSAQNYLRKWADQAKSASDPK